jgi:hypothetical protein
VGEIQKRNTAELETLAEQINAEHRAFKAALTTALERGIHAGELLELAKSKCKHGEWLPWLEKNFEGAPRTAQEYMRLYTHRDELRAKYAGSAHLSISGALKELATPKTDKHLGVEWEKAYRAWKQALETPEEPDRLATLVELDRLVRPADLLPSRLHGAFAEELTAEEMNTTFDILILTGSVASWETTKEDHIWRMHVAGNIIEEVPKGEDQTRLLIDLINAGTVRPSPIDAITAQIEAGLLGD